MIQEAPHPDIINQYGELQKQLAHYTAYESNPENIKRPEGLMAKQDLLDKINEMKAAHLYFAFPDGL